MPDRESIIPRDYADWLASLKLHEDRDQNRAASTSLMNPINPVK
jgi:hypothetical protein